MIQLTQLASDDFNRANEKPLSQGGNWSVNFAADPLQVVSDACEAGTLSAICRETYTGQALPNDQYASITLSALVSANGPHFYLDVRSNGAATASLTAYELVSATNSAVILYAYVSGVRTTIINSTACTIAPGDVWTLAAIGTTAYVIQNGNLLTSVSDNTVTSGNGGAGASAFTALTDIILSNFAVGSAATAPLPPNYYSVPDSRAVTAITPNSSRNVQNTLIYDVPKVDSRTAGAPVDSRKAGAPVDSRANIPSNSRKPGKYGPGEN